MMLSRRKGKVEVKWVRGHADSRGLRRTLSTAERGNVRADAICNMYRHARLQDPRLVLPRAASWRLCWRGTEVVRGLRRALREKLDAVLVLSYFEIQRRWGALAESWLGGEAVLNWSMRSQPLGRRVKVANCV